MQVLVTGPTGYIGGRLVRSLAARHDVICLSRRPVDGPYTSFRGAFHSFEDLRQLDDVPIEALVHLGAEVGGSTEEAALGVNVVGTRRLLRYLLDRGCRRFVLASSVAAAGCLDHRFLPEEVPIPDSHPCLARDAYGLSKALMEELAAYFHRRCPDADFLSLRLGGVIDELTWDAEPAPASPDNVEPFIDLAWVGLGDVIEVVERALEAGWEPGARVMNVVGPDSHTDDPVPAFLRASLGERAAELDLSRYEQPGHELDAVYSMDAARELLGFVPRIPMSPARFRAAAGARA